MHFLPGERLGPVRAGKETETRKLERICKREDLCALG